MRLRKLSRGLKAAYRNADVRPRVKRLDGWEERAAEDDPGPAAYDHADTVREYYDLCTEFMEFGWGESLHFAPLSPGESLEDAKIRHQRLMIARLELRPGMKVIDVGCGVGGPMRRVVRESGASVLGVNSSEVQLEKARSLNNAAGISDLVDYLSCSFMDMGAIPANSFDGGYAIESTCHAPDKAGAFAEIYRVLKPGALFWGQEMCLTDKFDPSDRRHSAIKRDLMHGIALKDIATGDEVDRTLEEVGFQLIEGKDLAALDGEQTTPWFQPMAARRGTVGNAVYRTPLGRKLLLGTVRLSEVLGMFPKGSTDVAGLLDNTADAYVAGGRAGIFTPLYCFLARKPE